ncbi:MAG: GNAT family N-acetyltransferase [Saprospiraceae bacterium]
MIKTERLQLRPMTLADAPFVLELLNTETWIEHIGERNIRTIAAARQYIQDKMINHYQIHGFGNYLISLPTSAEKIGCVSLYRREGFPDVDIGFAMLPAHMGNGYAYEAAAAVMVYATEYLKLPVISAFTTPVNIASQRLIEKLGLSFEKTMIWEETQEKMLYYVKKIRS